MSGLFLPVGTVSRCPEPLSIYIDIMPLSICNDIAGIDIRPKSSGSTVSNGDLIIGKENEGAKKSGCRQSNHLLMSGYPRAPLSDITAIVQDREREREKKSEGDFKAAAIGTRNPDGILKNKNDAKSERPYSIMNATWKDKSQMLLRSPTKQMLKVRCVKAFR